MKTLVTGATGFVGSALVRELLRSGHEVRALVRPDSDLRNVAGLPVHLVQGDLNRPESLDCALAGCTALFHAAADYRLWVPDPEAMYQTNITGTVHLMKAAARAGVKRVVYTSSVATLGTSSNGVPADEETPVTASQMIGPYKLSKFMAEAEVLRMVREEDLPAVIVNPSTPVGPRDVKCTPTGRMILNAAGGRMPAYVDTGLNLVHVDDVARGHVQAFERGKIGERYILGGVNMTLREILLEVARVTGRSPPRIRLPHGLVLPMAFMAEAWARAVSGREPLLTINGARLARKRMFYSSEKARQHLGFTTRPVQEALTEAVWWFRANGFLH